MGGKKTDIVQASSKFPCPRNTPVRCGLQGRGIIACMMMPKWLVPGLYYCNKQVNNAWNNVVSWVLLRFSASPNLYPLVQRLLSEQSYQVSGTYQSTLNFLWKSSDHLFASLRLKKKYSMMPMTKCWLIIPVKRNWTIDRATASSRFLCFFLIFERRSCSLPARELSQISISVIDGRFSKLINNEPRDTLHWIHNAIQNSNTLFLSSDILPIERPLSQTGIRRMKRWKSVIARQSVDVTQRHGPKQKRWSRTKSCGERQASKVAR